MRSVARLLLGGILLLGAWMEARAGGIAILGWHLSDNGDGDPFADTRETVTLRLTVQNTSGMSLTGVTARLHTLDTPRACLTQPQISLGSLTAGQTLETATGFVFVVPPGVQRGSVAQLLSATFRVDITSDQIADLAMRQEIGLDLDLDGSGGATPTTFTEGFEAGWGSFVGRNLDEGLFDPTDCCLPTPVRGYRCQSNIWGPYGSQRCNSGCSSSPNCSLGGSTEGAAAFWWGVDGSRAFAGGQSLHMGNAAGTSTPMGVLEAVDTASPIGIGRGRVCAVSRTLPCTTPATCPVGEACVEVLPTLSFKQQVSLMDSRSSSTPLGQAADRAVVLAQLAASDGTAIGDWMKLTPYRNVYDQQGTDAFTNCLFDPVDDGSDEDDLFDPGWSDLGPSSTCFGEFSFVNLGDTAAPFSPANTGNASDGPGLPGSLGPGTWVESRFSLARFRGRAVRLRFLNAGIGVEAGTWDQIFGDVGAGDDGWWIDTVAVEDALSAPAVVAVDTRANTGLPISLPDGDGDTIYDACDNCPAVSNGSQSDVDLDGIGDPCDACLHDAGNDGDGDGVCFLSDNCPETVNPGQEDGDDDGVGDICDNCPRHNPSQGLDEDGDGLLCAVDNCPAVTNPEQTDSDQDDVGDPCDPCPLDPGNDVDADEVCGDVDNCPTRANPEQGPFVEVAEGVDGFRFLPDGDTALLCDCDGFDHPGALHRLRLSSGEMVTLTPPMVDNSDVEADFVWTPDATRVIYRADPQTNGRTELWSIPAEGGVPTRLNDPPVGTGSVLSFRLGLDGSRVLYRASNAFLGPFQLHSVPVEGGAAVQLSQVTVQGGTAELGIVTPDGSRVVYRADETVDEVFELFSVPFAGGGRVKLSAPLAAAGDVLSFVVTADSKRVVYRADQAADNLFELFSVPAAGGPVVRLNGDLVAGADVLSYVVSPDGAWVAYVAKEGSSEWELFAVPAAGGPRIRLSNGARVPPNDTLRVGAGNRVLTRSSPGLDNLFEVWSVPFSGGTPVRVSGSMTPGGFVRSFDVSADGALVAYVADQETFAVLELFAAPVAGGGTNKLSGPMVSGGDVMDYRIGGNGERVVYRADQEVDGRIELFSGSVSAGGSVKLSVVDPAGATQVPDDDWVLSPDGSSVVYHARYSGRDELFACRTEGGASLRLTPGRADPILADFTADGGRLLYGYQSSSVRAAALEPDPDGDGILGFCDNCAGAANPGQVDVDADGFGPPCDCDDAQAATYPGAPEVNDGADNQCVGDAGHGEVDEVAGPLLFDGTTISWPPQAEASAYTVARAPGPTFASSCQAFSTPVASWMDADVPAAAFFYLVRADAPHVGSWGRNSQGLERAPACP